MIATLSGIIQDKDPSFLIVDVQGVGYEVRISLHTYGAVNEKEKIFLYTYFHVREDAQVLFGFATKSEKKMFLHLIGVNGIGPAIALVALSCLKPEELSQAIVQEQVSVIQGIKGIGAKTAQRVILELKDKLRKEIPESGGSVVDYHNNVRQEALSALIMLGISKTVAEKSVDAILLQNPTEPVEVVIKRALKNS